jgi:hypothetical protein
MHHLTVSEPFIPVRAMLLVIAHASGKYALSFSFPEILLCRHYDYTT